VTVFAGDGLPGMRDDPDKLKARFDRPIDVATDAQGSVFVSDANNQRIRRISPSGSVETAAGDGTRGFIDGAGVATRFFGQEQLEVTPDGKTVYVTDGSRGLQDQPYHRIRRVTIP
jgi:DNA-binding beta-propeller fold protein YncE